MRTKHMDMRMMQRGIGEDVVALVEKYGEFNAVVIGSSSQRR